MRHKITRFSSGSVEILYFIVGFLLFLTGCQPNIQTLNLTASYQNKTLSCGSSQLSQTEDWQIETLRFFVSKMALRRGGEWHEIQFHPNDWQHENVALVSLVVPDCQSAQINHSLSFVSPIDWQDAEAIRFSMGVPFERNHLNPLTQPSPLNLPAMFWSWQLGHKFIRLDMGQPQPREGGWSFHLGSIGCQSASRMRAPQLPCEQANLYQFELGAPNSNQLQLNLDQLLGGIALDTDRTCMFQAPDIKSCRQVLENLQRGKVFSWQ